MACSSGFVGDQEPGNREGDSGELVVHLMIEISPDGDVPSVNDRVEQVDPGRGRTVGPAEGQDADRFERSGMIPPRAQGRFDDSAEAPRRLVPDEVTASLADRTGRARREASKLLAHGRQMIDDTEHVPVTTGTCAGQRLSRNAVGEIGGREERLTQVLDDPGTDRRTEDRLHGRLHTTWAEAGRCGLNGDRRRIAPGAVHTPRRGLRP
jgi:hypothetical protein